MWYTLSPSIHVYESHAVIIAVPEVEDLIVRSSVTVESHPNELVNTQVGDCVET